MLAGMFKTRQIVLIVSALMLSGSLIAKADDGPIVISSETVCPGGSASSNCGDSGAAPVRKFTLPGFAAPEKTGPKKKGNYDLSGLLNRASPPEPKPRKAIASSSDSAPYLQALERQAPWVRGAVRWCDAFPGSPHCSEIDHQFPPVPDPKAVSRVYGLPTPQTK